MDTKILASFMLIIVLLSGCYYAGPSQLTLKPTVALTPVYATLPLTQRNTAHVVELARFEVEKAGPVAAIAFTLDGQELLAVYGQEGALRRWRVANGALLATMNIGPVGMAAVSFDAQARKVAIGAGKTSPTIEAGYDADFPGVRLWDTQTGKLLFEIEPEPNPAFATLYTDVALSPDGHWLVGVTGGGLKRWDATVGKRVCGGVYWGEINLYTDERTPGSWLLDVIIFDSTGELFAYATEAGNLETEEWAGHNEEIPCAGTKHWSLRQTGNPLGVPLALSFDPARRWLAAIMGKSLEVRNVQNGRVVLEAEVGEGPLASLAFSPDGTLLAVSTAKGWQIWGMDQKKLLAEETGQAVYAVAFSSDGRLFAWGDVEGVIHLWGVPEK